MTFIPSEVHNKQSLSRFSFGHSFPALSSALIGRRNCPAGTRKTNSSGLPWPPVVRLTTRAWSIDVRRRLAVVAFVLCSGRGDDGGASGRLPVRPCSGLLHAIAALHTSRRETVASTLHDVLNGKIIALAATGSYCPVVAMTDYKTRQCISCSWMWTPPLNYVLWQSQSWAWIKKRGDRNHICHSTAPLSNCVH